MNDSESRKKSDEKDSEKRERNFQEVVESLKEAGKEDSVTLEEFSRMFQKDDEQMRK